MLYVSLDSYWFCLVCDLMSDIKVLAIIYKMLNACYLYTLGSKKILSISFQNPSRTRSVRSFFWTWIKVWRSVGLVEKISKVIETFHFCSVPCIIQWLPRIVFSFSSRGHTRCRCGKGFGHPWVPTRLIQKNKIYSMPIW